MSRIGADLKFYAAKSFASACGQQHLRAAVEADLARFSLTSDLHVPDLGGPAGVLHDGRRDECVTLTGRGDQIDLRLDGGKSVHALREARKASPSGARVGKPKNRAGMDQATCFDQVLVVQDHPTHHLARPELFNTNFQTGSKRTSRGLVDTCAEVVGGPASGLHGHSSKSGLVRRRQRVQRR
jgi:hypothetical protein